VAAIMGGSFLYWLFVSRQISSIRHTFNAASLGRINRIAGLILIGFGGLLVGEMIMKRLRLM
jgi:hypothetical protein